MKGGENVIKVDSEFQSLIPPLTDDEYARLEKSILTEGVREPIITWNDTIIDGHNRWNICQKHGLECPQADREFESRDAAKIWIYGNQLGRRNLEAGQKAALVIERNEAKVREAARLRKAEHGNTAPGRPKNTGDQRNPSVIDESDPEPEKGRTAEILAKQAGVGEATIKRVLKVKHENPELYDKVRSGEVSTHAAYKQVTDVKRPQKTTDDGRRICTHCGKPINDGDSYKGREHIHKRCDYERRLQQQYKNPDISLIENVADFSIESLLDELVSVAENLRDSWSESIEINESQGVKLSNAAKKQLEKAVSNIFETLNTIKEDN